jgi:antitoxin component of MazEF toxin-antitoxin module
MQSKVSAQQRNPGTAPASAARCRARRFGRSPIPNFRGICQDIPAGTEVAMARVTVGRWGKNLAIRVPVEVAKKAGLSDGERVEIEARDGDIVIRRPSARARRAAVQVAEEIIEESRRHPLDRKAIRNLIDEGRRG